MPVINTIFYEYVRAINFNETDE